MRNRMNVSWMEPTSKLGLIGEFSLLRRIIKNKKATPDILCTLASKLLDADEYDEAIEILDKLQDGPSLRAEWLLATAYTRLHDFHKVIKITQNALSRQPNSANFRFRQGQAYLMLDELSRAEEELSLALKIDANHVNALIQLAKLRLKQGCANEAIKLCKQGLRIEPGRTEILSFLSVAYCEAGNSADLSTLMDYERLLLEFECFSDSSKNEINSELEKYIETHPLLHYQPTAKATRYGWHVGFDDSDDKECIISLRREIMYWTEYYVARLKDLPTEHPLHDRYTGTLRLHMWGSVLRKAGRQLPHVHPPGWLSGVYYVSVPKTINRGGWIEFGRPHRTLPCSKGPMTKVVEPIPGKLILFPSYFFHRTYPLEREADRVSIAFDLLPGGRR